MAASAIVVLAPIEFGSISVASRYPLSKDMVSACAIMGTDPARVMRRAGLPEDFADGEQRDVTGEQLFDIWDAMTAEAQKPNIEFEMAIGYAHGPFSPPLLSFSTAPNLELGLQRLAVYKPIIAPLILDVTRHADGVTLEFRCSLPDLKIPAELERFDIYYIIECARSFSGVHVVPTEVGLVHDFTPTQPILDFLQCRPTRAPHTRLSFSLEDAELPLVTRSAAVWDGIEPILARQLAELKEGNRTVTGRVQRLLTEALPGGCSVADDAARRLGMSKRSLQRRLAEEGTSFKSILVSVRRELSASYLKDSDLSVPEISHLLGFRDTSSFFRAFQGWHGTTPKAYRDKG